MKWCMKETVKADETTRFCLRRCVYHVAACSQKALLCGFRELNPQDIVHPWTDLCRTVAVYTSLGKPFAPARDVVDG